MQRLTVDGKRRDLGLGGYPYVGLAEARAAAFSNRQLARRRGVPTAALQRSRVPTFRTACERVDAAATLKGQGPENRRRALERYCGSILDRRLDQIRRADVIVIPAPLMAEKRVMGSKLHGWIRGALAWGVAREHLEFNVAEGIGAALPAARKGKKHHAALPYAEVGAALDAIAACTASEALKSCLRFIILTAVRSGEARGATWSEIDPQAAGVAHTGRAHEGRPRASRAVVAGGNGHAGTCQEPAQSCRLVLPGPVPRQSSDARDDAGAGRQAAVRRPRRRWRCCQCVSRARSRRRMHGGGAAEVLRVAARPTRRSFQEHGGATQPVSGTGAGTVVRRPAARRRSFINCSWGTVGGRPARRAGTREGNEMMTSRADTDRVTPTAGAVGNEEPQGTLGLGQPSTDHGSQHDNPHPARLSTALAGEVFHVNSCTLVSTCRDWSVRFHWRRGRAGHRLRAVVARADFQPGS